MIWVEVCNLWADPFSIDKNVRIGDRVVISPKGKQDGNYELYSVSDGVIVVPNGTVIPSDTVL